MGAFQPVIAGIATASAIALHVMLQRRSGKQKPKPNECQSSTDTAAAEANTSPTGTTLAKQCAPPCTAAAEQAVARLCGVYDGMAAAFAAEGLDLAAIAETAAWFETGPPAPWPRRYASFHPAALPPGAVRLVVVPLAACCPRLASSAAGLAAHIMAQLPPGCKVFSNARQNLHITVFHYSHPVDPRPDALQPHSGLLQYLPAGAGGADSNREQQAAVPATVQQHQQATAEQQLRLKLDPRQLPAPHERPGPTPEQLQAEQAALVELAAGTPQLTLQLERVLLARSGVLLLTWLDPSGALASLRQALHRTFPGACSKQSNIIHTSLFRIVGTPSTATAVAGAAATAAAAGPVVFDGMDLQQLWSTTSINSNAAGVAASAAAVDGGAAVLGEQLSPELVAQIDAACNKWTEELRGSTLVVDHLWWVCEEEFSSIEGQRLPVQLGSTAVHTNVLN